MSVVGRDVSCSPAKSLKEETINLYSAEEVLKSFNSKSDRKCLIINGNVYDVTLWMKRHPGGAKIIAHYCGQDATDAFVAFHPDQNYVHRFLNPLLIGKVNDWKTPPIVEEFREMREDFVKKGYFEANYPFFVAFFLQSVITQLLSMYLLYTYPLSISTFLLSSVLLTISQAQLGWTQHDYGHHTVFSNSTINRVIHEITCNILKGASCHWWNFRHNQHHAKPNIAWKDPDIMFPSLFIMGNKLPIEWGKRKRKGLPYQYQHGYFFLLGPPILLPIYFHFENVYFVIKRRNFKDLTCMVFFFVHYFYIYGSLIGGGYAFALYMFTRFLESHWFTWTTQMSHIPMEIERDEIRDWVHMQLYATCNVEGTFFNNWFSGHLSYQIEHHLFPLMPRHNFAKVAPIVRSFCEKHGLEYVSKPMLTAFADVVRSLKKSGQLWYEAYHLID